MSEYLNICLNAILKYLKVSPGKRDAIQVRVARKAPRPMPSIRKRARAYMSKQICKFNEERAKRRAIKASRRKAKHTQTDRQEELNWLQDMMPSMPELESLPIIECARNAYFSEQLQSILSVALVTCGFLISFYICLDVLKNL